MQPQPVKKNRIDVIDALRGFAVMAILLVHSIEHFIYNVYPPQTILDEGTLTVIFSLFAGKAYAIFALLFGFTYYIQLANRQAKGDDFAGRFVWRLMLLAGFATLNAAFFPGGDVLSLFCITGLALPLVRKLSNKWVFAIAIIFLLQPVELYHYAASLFHAGHTLPDLGVAKLYGEVFDAVKTGNWGTFLTTNITTGQAATLLWAVGAGRFGQTIGLFLLGYLLARKQLFVPSEKNTAFWTKTLITAAIAFGPLYALKVQIADGTSVDLIKQSVGTAFDMWQKLAFTLVLVSGFVLAYQRETFQKWTTSLRFYGRMSLTNYIGQSILGALVFFPIGLNLAPHTGYFASLLIGVALFAVQLAFCKLWLKTHKQGPLETLWHRLTWLKSK